MMRYNLLIFGGLIPLICGATNDLQLDEYLESRNFFNLRRHQFSGYVTDGQKCQMNEVLAAHPNIKTIGEIGLNAGHSADNFFDHCKQLERFISFDIQSYPEVLDYFSAKYKDQFLFIHGDSSLTVPEFAAHFPDVKFDLIFIDGAHSYENCYRDILNMKLLAHAETLLWIDDYACPEMIAAVETCKNIYGILEVIKVHSSDRRTAAERCWLEARYLCPEAVEIK